MLDIANNPASRLALALNTLREHGGSQLRVVWERAAPALALGGSGDPVRIRAELGYLFRETENAVLTLPLDDDREALLAERGSWARPIFGWDMRDDVHVSYGSEELVSTNAINALKSLGSILRRNSPEFVLVRNVDNLEERLANIYDQLGDLLVDVTTEEGIGEQARASISRPVISAMEDVTYARLRGLRTLYENVHFARAHIVADGSAGDSATAQPLKRTQRWFSAILRTLVNVEQIMVPVGASVATALATGDPLGALTAGVTARLALGAGGADEKSARENGSNGEAS